ncbi:regulator of G-protein signaling 21-like [Engraulis encrasicolus]|uniref:regulator of G-protein signaling 21-like n=1 Tax=Engraulis encrasicolus TaxID=184585 RepID=UPI002FD76BFF
MKYVPFPSVESHGSPRQNLCSAVLKLSPGALIEAQLPPLVNARDVAARKWLSIDKSADRGVGSGRAVLSSMKNAVKDLNVIFKGRFCCFSKDPLVDVDAWGESIDKLLACKAGQAAFQEFLKTEYSEENILFWLACEDYKKIKSTPEMIVSANRIYAEFVQTEAPKQINIDCGTRANITKNINQPDLNSFDTAQRLIYSLMTRDCYPRFLKSDIYQGVLQNGRKG